MNKKVEFDNLLKNYNNNKISFCDTVKAIKLLFDNNDMHLQKYKAKKLRIYFSCYTGDTYNDGWILKIDNNEIGFLNEDFEMSYIDKTLIYKIEML